MCGIVGVTGPEPALPVLLEGLARLEYRGYDSAGVALHRDGELWRRRRKGKLAELVAAVDDAPATAGTGIGHTRWATHGAPSEGNAHPQTDCRGRVVVVHNGIIENYLELFAELPASHERHSQTDTEVLAHLIEHELDNGLALADAVRACLRRIDGKYAIAVLHADDPDLIVAARRGSPLIAARTDDSGFVASDIPALLARTREIYVVDDGQVVEVRPGELRFTDLDGNAVEPERRDVPWNLEAAEKAGYDDFMLKEIHEQPQAVRDTLLDRCRNGRLHLDDMKMTVEDLEQIDKVFIVGCGTSYYASLVARHAIEHWTRLPVEVDIASEFRYRDPVLDAHTLVVCVSQSGETLDTMEACEFAKQPVNDAKVLTVCNVVDSSLARMADAVLYTRAGWEVGVAATKTHVAQIIVLELLALYLAQIRHTLYPDEITRLVSALDELPALIERVLAPASVEQVTTIAQHYVDVRDFFFLGRGVGYPVALEGALKLKEISYARAEAYPAGEMKHGPIALIEPGTVVVAVATRGHLHQKMLANIQEMRARGATILVVANAGDTGTADQADDVLWVPSVPAGAELFSPAVDVVALQLFAYALAKARGCDVDKPRNLAKTVTVE